MKALKAFIKSFEAPQPKELNLLSNFQKGGEGDLTGP